MQQQKSDLLHILAEQNRLGIPLAKIKQSVSEQKREQVKQRRQEEVIKKEKLKYWHLIKRDVLKHKKEIATQEALEGVEQSKRFTKWFY